MEPNKFEENIRTKLEEREIQPSPEAWNKLEAQLGTAHSSNKTLWYAIAASLVAILVVGSFLLKEDATVSDEIVEQTNPSETIKNTEVATSEEDKTVENTLADDKTESQFKETPAKSFLENNRKSIATSSEKQREKIEQNQLGGNNLNTGTAETIIAQVEKNSTAEKEIEQIKKEDFISLKVDEVVAKVENLQTTNTTVTAQDVEALLQKAQRDIANQRLLEQATVKIDPASLLNDVENELERSFRDKVFDALGEGFNKIRTAVVERNN